MYQRDLVVAMVAIGLGVAIIRGMWINSQWCFRLNTAATLDQMVGRTWARWILGAVGAVLIWIGGILVAGPFLAPDSDARIAPLSDWAPEGHPVSWNE